MIEKTQNDLVRISELLIQREAKLERFYKALEDENLNERKSLDEMCNVLSLEINDKNRFALASRMASLRDDALFQVLEASRKDENEIIKAKEESYLWVSEFHCALHDEFIQKVKQENLLNRFYQTLLEGVGRVGHAFSGWQSSWTAHIIHGVNRDLLALCEGDEEKVFHHLATNELFDKSENGDTVERSYSVLVDHEGEFRSVAYSKAFEDEVSLVVRELVLMIEALKEQEDDLFDQKEVYIAYLDAIVVALREEETSLLLKRWGDVDRAWMKITAPVQVGHPLEYYEDHFRKAVALEWDVRIVDPCVPIPTNRVETVKKAYETIATSVEAPSKASMMKGSFDNLNRTQLYISRPALYYGAEFCGLFSAQVVPNDETVSRELGKKIFAFPSQVISTARAKPFLQISREFLGQEFLNYERNILFRQPEMWYKVYDISTIGHEYGHILWIDHDTESVMNKSGQFKNIEEFKATTGGLIAFFLHPDETLKRAVMGDLVKRSIGLIAWMKTGEVLPYFCEGLIHLEGLFATQVLSYEGKLTIDMSRFEELKEWYIHTYKNLANHYANKLDAALFLDRFVKRENGEYWPKDENVRKFVQAYWDRYCEIGQNIDTEDKKENWLSVG